jgi:hypothetical protein
MTKLEIILKCKKRKNRIKPRINYLGIRIEINIRKYNKTKYFP